MSPYYNNYIMRGKLRTWQVFGIISGFCFLYSLFLPVKEIDKDNLIDTIYGYELIVNQLINLTDYILNSSMTDNFLIYSYNYFILICMIVMLISMVILLWTCISSNSIIAILMSIIYAPLAMIFIITSIDFNTIVSLGFGFYLLIISSVSAIILPIIYALYN